MLIGLRHLPGGTEPARVFAALAAMCTPALCDEVVIDMAELEAKWDDGDRTDGARADAPTGHVRIL